LSGLLPPTKGKPDFPSVSVLHLEFEIPKRWSNKLYSAAGSCTDPFPKIEELIADSIPNIEGDEEVRLIGFVIND